MTNITQSEILEALQQALGGTGPEDPASAVTVAQLCASTGFGRSKIRNDLRALYDAGKVEVVHIRGKMMDGRACMTPAYRLKEG